MYKTLIKIIKSLSLSYHILGKGMSVVPENKQDKQENAVMITQPLWLSMWKQNPYQIWDFFYFFHPHRMEIQQEQLFWYSPSKSIFDPKQKHTLRRVKLSTFLTSKRIVSHLYYIWGKGFNFSSLSILQKKIQTKIPKINVLPRTQLIIIYLLNSIDKKKSP